MKKTGFEVFSHTADMGITIYGRTLKELFTNAARGMFAQITDLEKINPKKVMPIRAEAQNLEELLIRYLNELLFLFAVKNMAFKVFQFASLSEIKLKGVVKGEALNKGSHPVYREIKAATYHMLQVKRTKNGWRAKVIFDL